MSGFTRLQRDILQRRLARAICYRQVPSSYRDDAIRLANVVIDELDSSMTTGSLARRAIVRIVENMENTG